MQLLAIALRTNLEAVSRWTCKRRMVLLFLQEKALRYFKVHENVCVVGTIANTPRFSIPTAHWILSAPLAICFLMAKGGAVILKISHRMEECHIFLKTALPFTEGPSVGIAVSQGITKRCRLSWLTNIALIYEPKCGGRGGVVGSQPMSTAVDRSPNKLWRTNFIFNLCCQRIALAGQYL